MASYTSYNFLFAKATQHLKTITWHSRLNDSYCFKKSRAKFLLNIK